MAKADLTDIKDVDFDGFKLKKKEVSINGRKLPLKIGDRLKLTDSDQTGRTVMGMVIHEDGHIQYIIEWCDPNSGSFQTEQLTLSELRLLHANRHRQTGVPGFSGRTDS